MSAVYYLSIAEGSQEVQHKKGLDGDLQPNPKLQWVLWDEKLWDYSYSSSNYYYLFKYPLQTT